jgi:outer membrane protein
MRKYLAISVLALIVAMPFPALAQTASPKIGYIDLQKVMMESEKGKEVKKSLTDEFEKARKTLTQKQDELQKIKDTLEKQTTTMTPDARADKEKQYQAKVKDYQRLQTDYEAELRQKDQELSQKLLKELEEIVKGLGESEKYTLILERSQAGILFATPAVDATDKIISLYNESAKKKAAPKK